MLTIGKKLKPNFASEILALLVQCWISMVLSLISTTLTRSNLAIKVKTLKMLYASRQNFNPENLPKEIIQAKRKIYPHKYSLQDWMVTWG